MRPLHAILLALTSLAVPACNVSAEHAIGTTTTGTVIGTTTTTATNGTTTTTIGTTTTSSCPEGPLECGWTGLPPCPEGTYCYSVDPCGDYPTCMPFPAACATTPTCACLIAAGALDLGSNFVCTGSGTGMYAYDNAGATECCP